MTNAASDLVSVLKRWDIISTAQTVATVHGAGELEPLDFWREQIHAVELLREVDEQLQGLEQAGLEVSHYRESYVGWCHGVFAPNLNWSVSQSSGQMTVDSADIRILQGFADFLDAIIPPQVLDPARIKSSRDALDEVIDILAGGTLHLDPRSGRYAFFLINSVRTLLDSQSATGSPELARRIAELYGFLSQLADELQQDEPTRTVGARLRAAGARIYPWAARGTIAAGFALDALSNLKQIGS